MPHTPQQLLSLSDEFEQKAQNALVVEAKKKEKKLDPKAKVRNRGTVCVPAEQAKDKKDHFPINSEDQARNALSRVHQYSTTPEWYKGSLKGLQALVAKKVKSKYPKINVGGKDKKKSSFEEIESMLNKYAQSTAMPTPGVPNDLSTTSREPLASYEPTGSSSDPSIAHTPANQSAPKIPAQTKPHGQYDPYVAKVQKFLTEKKLNPPSNNDGVWGNITSDALKKWQEGMAELGSDVQPTGQLDGRTIHELGSLIGLPGGGLKRSATEYLLSKYSVR